MLTASQRQWLSDALALVYDPDHPWRSRLHSRSDEEALVAQPD